MSKKVYFFILPAVTYAVPRRIVFSMMSWTSEMSTLKDCEQACSQSVELICLIILDDGISVLLMRC